VTREIEGGAERRGDRHAVASDDVLGRKDGVPDAQVGASRNAASIRDRDLNRIGWDHVETV